MAHVPGINDHAIKAARLKRTNEEMRRRIMELKGNLAQERTQSRKAQEQRLQELRGMMTDREVGACLLLSSGGECLPKARGWRQMMCGLLSHGLWSLGERADRG